MNSKAKTIEEYQQEIEDLKSQLNKLQPKSDQFLTSTDDDSVFYYLGIQEAPVAIFFIEDKHIISLNRETEIIYGKTAGQLKSLPFLSFVHNEDRALVQKHLLDQSKTDASLEVPSFRLDTGEDRFRWVSLKSKRVKHSDQTLVMCIQSDISEQYKSARYKELYQVHLEEQYMIQSEELKSALSEAKKANEVKDTFLQNMSHEFRTPIHHITSFSRMGLDKTKAVLETNRNSFVEKLNKYFQGISDSSQKLFHFIMNLFDLSLLESKENTYFMGQHNLLEIINLAYSHSSHQKPDQKLDLNFINGEDVFEVECDQNWLMKAIKHILSNAIKFSPDVSDIAVDVKKLAASSEEADIDSVKVSISDHGIGIPDDELEMVFEKFTQSSRSKDGSGGKGIGLAICKKIIENHHGSIWIDNNPEEGITVQIILPIKQPEEIADQTASAN